METVISIVQMCIVEYDSPGRHVVIYGPLPLLWGIVYSHVCMYVR
jgi:hypothetical protein